MPNGGRSANKFRESQKRKFAGLNNLSDLRTFRKRGLGGIAISGPILFVISGFRNYGLWTLDPSFFGKCKAHFLSSFYLQVFFVTKCTESVFQFRVPCRFQSPYFCRSLRSPRIDVMVSILGSLTDLQIRALFKKSIKCQRIKSIYLIGICC